MTPLWQPLGTVTPIALAPVQAQLVMAAQLLEIAASVLPVRGKEANHGLAYVPQLNALTGPRASLPGSAGSAQWLLAVPEFAYHVIAEEDLDGVPLAGRSASDILDQVVDMSRRLGARVNRPARVPTFRFGHPEPAALAELDRYLRNTSRVLNRLRNAVSGAGPVRIDAERMTLTVEVAVGGRKPCEAGLCLGTTESEPFWFVGTVEQPQERVTATDLLRRGADAESELEVFLRAACERRLQNAR